MTGRVSFRGHVTRAQLRAEPDTLFLFGDNMMGRGYAGQAREMRDEPNALGIPTKWKPSMSEDSFFTDDDFEVVVKEIGRGFDVARDHIMMGKNVVIPMAGLGTGLAELPKRAPRVAAYIADRVRELTEL